jgi:hypothetical protein
MKFSKPMIAAIALFATFAVGTLPSQAQAYGAHPAYLHALSDLRLMRAYLDRLTPNERVDDESVQAIAEIDAAINEIKIASIDDGKDLWDHVPIDAHIAPTDRFHKAREAGNAAFADINREEDNDYARGLKHRALDHIARANQIVDHIIQRVDGGPGYGAPAPGGHPAYLHALSDLRLMRAYLDRLTPDERIDDESAQAIGEIDAAINEIKLASIDDGKDLRDHMPIDAHITPTDRFHKAREAGNAAWADINREEDNDYARGLKHRALDHIEKANHIVDHIVRRFDNM